MKNKLLKSLLLFSLLLVLAACGSSNSTTEKEETKSEETKLIRIGFTPGPYSDQVKKAIEPILAKKGYKIEIIEFSNGRQPNFSLAEGDLEANIFQHTAYFEDFIQVNNLDLTELIKVPTAPMGIYSDKYDSLENLDTSKTYKVAIPNDPPNIARALRILEQAKLVTLKENYSPLTVGHSDIEKYAINIDFVEVEQPQLARTIQDVDFALVNGNYILAADRKLSSSLLLENPPHEYQNLVAVRSEDVDKQFVKDLVEAYESEEFQKLIETDPAFEGFHKPAYFK